jgi:hypothetical protein
MVCSCLNDIHTFFTGLSFPPDRHLLLLGVQSTTQEEIAMTNKISRRKFVSNLGAATAVAGAGLALPEGDARANPDPANIRPQGSGFKVFPTGGDDRDNIEWALTNVPAGATVRLVAGTFKLGSTAIVPNFNGKLLGAGSKKTTITCTDEYNYELWEAPGGGKDLGEPEPPPFPRSPIPGSLTKTAPGMIFFYKTPLEAGEDPADRATSIEIRGIRCRSAMIGEEWSFGDEVLSFLIVNTVDFADLTAEPEPTRQDVKIVDILVDGYATDEFPVFGNACACLTVIGSPVFTNNYDLTGVTDGDGLGASNGALMGARPAEGDVTFRDCTFVNCRLGPGVVGHKDSDLLWDNVTTDGCRGNCLQLIDNSGCHMVVRNCDLFCDSFLLPPELTPGGLFTDIPSSLGCVMAIQGFAAAVGSPLNLRYLELALDPVAHAAGGLPSGPLGTWRPLGPAFIPAPSTLEIHNTRCRSPNTPNSYCFHVIDAANGFLSMPSLGGVSIHDNDCEGSQTCIGIEHTNDAVINKNKCDSTGFGIELHNSFNADIRDNKFMGGSTDCAIHTLALGQKRDFYAVQGTGVCTDQA